MNRSQRRKNKIKQKDPVLCIKSSELEQKVQEAKNEAVNEVFMKLLGIPCMVLKDKYGWGSKKRLPEFADAVLDYYENWEDTKTSLDDLQDFIFQQTGIKFQKL